MQLGYYPDLSQEIMQAVEEVGESVYDFMQVDLETFSSIDTNYLSQIDSTITYRDLVVLLMKIQEMVNKSSLENQHKLEFWRPIAETFVRVKETLSERFVPLSDRQLIAMGETFTVRAIFFKKSTSRGYEIGSALALPPYKYAVLDQDEDDVFQKVALSEIGFPYGYLDDLPEGLKKRLHYTGKIELPVKLVDWSDGTGKDLVVIDFDELGWEV